MAVVFLFSLIILSMIIFDGYIKRVSILKLEGQSPVAAGFFRPAPLCFGKQQNEGLNLGSSYTLISFAASSLSNMASNLEACLVCMPLRVPS